MFELRVVQADFGDSLILAHGDAAAPRHVLIDGGPEGVYDPHLRAELRRIDTAGGEVELVVLSHVDSDHAIGLLELFAELQDQRANGLAETVRLGKLWHNSFARTLDGGGGLENRLRSALALAQTASMPAAMAGVMGIGEGQRLRILAAQLGLPVNDGFAQDLICVDDAPAPVQLGTLTLRVVGPTRANLQELRLKWEKWLDDNEPALQSGDPRLMANADKSIPNLSSIMLLAECQGRTVLLTGDGRSDHLLSGLDAAGLLDGAGKLHVDVLKVPHHGSDRNATKTFFRKVTADTYVISANGHPDNPDLATLIWIVEAAAERQHRIDIFATNQTPALDKLADEYPAADYGYRLDVMPAGRHAESLVLAP
jgi:hypothetical protein